MKILAIESSAGPASCAVTEDGRLLASSAVHTGLMHSQTLIPMVDAMLRGAGIPFDGVDLLAVAAGPGSFTGIRIGVAAVKGMAFAQNKPCVGVSTLASMARAFQGLPYTGLLCAAMDARCRQVYTALFESRNGEIRRIAPDEAISVDSLENTIISLKKPVILFGDGAELCYNTFGSDVPCVTIAPPALRYQSAIGVALEAAEGTEKAVDASELRPIYLRLPQAERELKRRMQPKSG